MFRAGWTVWGQKGSHGKLTNEEYPNILSIPVYTRKPIKKGLLLDQVKKANLAAEEFLECYKSILCSCEKGHS